MKRIKKGIAAIALCTISISAIGCKMIEKTPEAIAKTTLAKVGKEKITQADLDLDFKQYDVMFKQQYGEDYASNEEMSAQIKEIKQQILNNLVDQKVLLQKAEEIGAMPTEEEINKKFDENMAQFVGEDGDDEEYKKFLDYYGFTEEVFNEYQKNQSTMSLIFENITKDASVSDEDVQNYYDEQKETLYTVAGPINFDKSLEAANEIEKELKDGADFATIAKEKSEDTGTKENGGSLGFINYDDTQYVTEFMDGFKDLKEGEISEPVKSQFGYHIIKVTGVTEDGAEVSHILVAEKDEGTVTPLEDVKEEISEKLKQDKVSEIYTEKLEELKDGLNIKLYEDRI